MDVAVLTFDGFNELDSMIAAAMINRVEQPALRAWIVGREASITSMNGLVVEAQKPWTFARQADAVIIGSGARTRALVQDQALLDSLELDPKRQLIGAQCSGVLMLHALGLVTGPVTTDEMTRPWLEDLGLNLVDSPLVCRGSIAMAGGCLSSHYLAAWTIGSLAGWAAAEEVVRYVAPVGQKKDFVQRASDVVQPQLAQAISKAV